MIISMDFPIKTEDFVLSKAIGSPMEVPDTTQRSQPQRLLIRDPLDLSPVMAAAGRPKVNRFRKLETKMLMVNLW
jgi:hypothetical protein